MSSFSLIVYLVRFSNEDLGLIMKTENNLKWEKC